MSSPEPSAVARMITLAPTIFLKGSGSGRSLDPKGGGRCLVGMFQPASALPSRLVVSAMPYPPFSRLPTSKPLQAEGCHNAKSGASSHQTDFEDPTFHAHRVIGLSRGAASFSKWHHGAQGKGTERKGGHYSEHLPRQDPLGHRRLE